MKRERLATQDKTKPKYCRSCLKQMEVNSKVCESCGVFHKDGGQVTKPKGVK